MRACWTFSPGDRISFRSIVEELVLYQNEDFRANAYYHTQASQAPVIVNMDSINNNNDDDDDEKDLLLVDDNDSEQH